MVIIQIIPMSKNKKTFDGYIKTVEMRAHIINRAIAMTECI